MKNKKGFTLVELIAVIAILAVIVLVALPNVLGVFNKSIEEVMKIEETQATDAGSLYVRDHCGRTAKSKDDRSKCRNDVTTQKIEGKVYFCLSEIRGKGYIDEIKYKGNTKCDGIVLYEYDDEEVTFSKGKTYLVCDNDLYITPELKEKEENIFNEYKEIIKDCPDSSYEEAPEPEPNPNPEPAPTPTNSIYVVLLDNVGGTSTGNSQIYLKYGEGWYSDSEGVNSIKVVNIPVKTGNEFKGYYTGQNGTGTKVIDENGLIQAGEEKVFNTNGTLYASWMASTYKLTLDNDGATTPGTEAIYEKYGIGWYSEQAGTNSLTSIVVPVKKGYTFNGYNLNETEIIKDTGEINNNTTVINTDTETSASYTPRIYSVILNTEGADTIGTPAIYLKYNTGWYSNYETTTIVTKITIPKKTNHLFEGYYTGEDGSGTQVIDENGNIKSGQTTIFSNETNTGVLYAKWKEDTTCTYSEPYYVGQIYTTSKSGSGPKIRVINALTNKNEEVNSSNKTTTFSQFAVTYDYRSNDYSMWRLYAQEDGLYYSTKENPTKSELKALTYITWSYTIDVKYYIFKIDCIKKPAGMTYVGSVFNVGPAPFRVEAYAIDNIGNKKQLVSSDNGSTGVLNEFTNFAVTYDYRYNDYSMWRMYGNQENLFYSTKEVSKYEDLKPLAGVTWSYAKEQKYYIYKKSKVDTPKNYTYVGSAAMVGPAPFKVESYAIDSIGDKKQLVSSDNGSTAISNEFTNFAITYDYRTDYSKWRIYALDDDIYYSTKETTNEADLKLLSNISISYVDLSKYYIYKKNSVKKPSNMTYVGVVYSAGLAPFKVEAYGINRLNNTKGLLSGTNSYKDFDNFVLRYDYRADYSKWRLYAKDDDLFYSEKETTNISDLKPLSCIEFSYAQTKRYYIYKKNKVDTPDNMTYVGSAFTAGTVPFGPNFTVNDAINNKKEVIETDSNIHDYTNFAITYDYRTDYSKWRIYALDDDIYYSTKETTNISDLKPLSFLTFDYSGYYKYYFYKKGKVDTPNSYTYVGNIFNCGTAGFRAEAYVINKLRNIEEKIPAGTLMKDYGNFYITYYSNGTTISEWRMTAVDNDLYYSTKETSSASDLKPLTYLNWSYAINAKYYIYKKN